MTKLSKTMKLIIYIISITFLFSCLQQKTETVSSEDSVSSDIIIDTLTYKDSILKIVKNTNLKCDNAEIKKGDNKNWSFCNLENGMSLYIVEYEQNNFLYTEKYLTQNNKLIYAVEWEKSTTNINDNEDTYSNYEYIIENGVVLEHMSLGMGWKTEDEFNHQNIVDVWNTRKTNFSN